MSKVMSRKRKLAYAEECVGRILALFPYKITANVVAKYDSGNDATCEPENEYFRVKVNINLDEDGENQTQREIAQSIFHECQHILVFPLDQYAVRLAKQSGDPKVHKKQLIDVAEYVVTSIELAYFALVFPEFAE